MTKIKLTACPNCGNKNLKKVHKTVTGIRHGKRYSAPDVEFYECPDCDERIYDPVAIRQIEEHSHVPLKHKPARKIA